MHSEKAEPVVQNDVEFHRELERHERGEQVDRTQERDLGVLPHHVAAAKPRAPERRLAIFDDALENLPVVGQMLIPVCAAQGQRPGQQRGAQPQADGEIHRRSDVAGRPAAVRGRAYRPQHESPNQQQPYAVALCELPDDTKYIGDRAGHLIQARAHGLGGRGRPRTD